MHSARLRFFLGDQSGQFGLNFCTFLNSGVGGALFLNCSVKKIKKIIKHALFLLLLDSLIVIVIVHKTSGSAAVFERKP